VLFAITNKSQVRRIFTKYSYLVPSVYYNFISKGFFSWILLFWFCLQYKLTVPKMGVVSNLCNALSNYVNVEPEKVSTFYCLCTVTILQHEIL